ncbi:HAD family hydrolase [Paenibacillus sp. KN14-4R]|uniref:HAD family hydrolase n=1 Tax=Paenibacillus sp. KN14-4R TaxID=3445773 RepID=UPI003FA033D2
MGPFFTQSGKKVVFFDMNNTLVDRRKCFDMAFHEVLQDFTGRWKDGNASWNPNDVLQVYKLEWSKHRKSHIKGSSQAEDMRMQCLTKALEPYSFKLTPTFMKAFFNAVDDAEESYVTLFPGVDDTLRALSEKYTLAIISNGSRKRLEKNWSQLKLGKWFTHERIFSSQQDGYRKPHPAIYESAMKAMNCSPSHAIMVGNSWKNDVLGATKCGMDAIWIHPNHMKKISQRKIGKQRVIIIRALRLLTQVL